MRIVIAPDSFKESLSAAEVARALAAGVARVDKEITCQLIPLADGGEGFAESLATALDAERIELEVDNPLGVRWPAMLAIDGDERAGEMRAIVECAQAVGLERLDEGERDIFSSHTRGLGQLIRAALDRGASEIIVGLGGSATNDGGAGMLAELGVRFLDDDGRELEPHPRGLRRCAVIDVSGLDDRIDQVRIKAACDVNNPLLGARGASATYGPQKGASDTEVAELDEILEGLTRASVRGWRNEPARDLAGWAEHPGAGAAGGLGWALLAFLGAEFVPGIDLVCQTVGLSEAVAEADVVFTGEGAIDAQTSMGKTLSGVADIAQQHQVPVVGFAGKIAPDAAALYERGFAVLMPIVSRACSHEQALASAADNLKGAAEVVTRALRVRLGG